MIAKEFMLKFEEERKSKDENCGRIVQRKKSFLCTLEKFPTL